MDSLIKEFSARFSQFKELSETFKFIMYPDVISFDKLNLSHFDWLEIEELEMQLIDFQSSSIWIQKFIKTRKRTATAGSDVVQSGRPIFDDFFQHLWPYIGNNTANVVFQMVKRLWLIRIDQ
ncbi:dimer_Tnp_hAT domain-containing protein [Trichonephila clavipes]|nr:dimer_Tnp_hAT domain-containing protein [Trichonephila clavipes]